MGPSPNCRSEDQLCVDLFPKTLDLFESVDQRVEIRGIGRRSKLHRERTLKDPTL